MSLKVLPLNPGPEAKLWWSRFAEEVKLYGLGVSTEPKIKRPGFYKDGKVAWYEISDTEAYIVSTEIFDRELSRYNTEEMTAEEKKAIMLISQTRFATKNQMEQAENIRFLELARKNTWRTRLACKRAVALARSKQSHHP